MHSTLGNARFVSSVRSVAGMRGDRDGRYHWYGAGGARFCHWYDRAYGRDWFGFYAGGFFFWSLYWDDYFWWYDPYYAQWLWYGDGDWWQYGPGGTPEMYEDDEYDGAEAQPYAPEPAQETQAPPARQAEYHYSGDGTRLVEIEGADASAYLYDLTRRDEQGQYTLIRYLGSGVTGVQFTDPSYGGPLQIILDTRDAYGNPMLEALDADGDSLSGRPAWAGSASSP